MLVAAPEAVWGSGKARAVQAKEARRMEKESHCILADQTGACFFVGV